MAFNFLPRDEQYFVLFEEAARNITQGALLLQDLVERFDDVEAKAARIRVVEEAGDEITFRIISRLGRSFITPIEREDIFAIARHLDDVVDFIEASAVRLATYAIDQPTEPTREFAALILRAARELEKLLALLHRKDLEQIRQPKIAINQVESEADRLLRRVVAGLFTSGADPLTVMKWKEIYETLEEVTDRLESLANLIEGIIVKNT
jgi:predicted phosphate transport protein (TIGR00153 family)